MNIRFKYEFLNIATVWITEDSLSTNTEDEVFNDHQL